LTRGRAAGYRYGSCPAWPDRLCAYARYSRAHVPIQSKRNGCRVGVCDTPDLGVQETRGRSTGAAAVPGEEQCSLAPTARSL